MMHRRFAAVVAAVLMGAGWLNAPSAGAAPDGFDLQAHRAGRGETTEQSLRAFAKALEVGVDTFELDIVLSKDSEPMVWHDESIEATKCSDTAPVFVGDPEYPYVGKLVRDLTLEQIRTLDCGKLLSGFPSAEVVEGNTIATLPEVFALTDSYGADVRFNIEPKADAEEPQIAASPMELVDSIMVAVRAANKVDKVAIQSFNWQVLPLVQQADPSIPRGALWDDTTWVPGSPWLNGIDPAAVGDPVTGAVMAGANIASPGYSVPYGQTPADPGFKLVADRAFVDHAHAVGLKVIPWTINDVATMNAQIDAGVDGIITDYPTTLRDVMAGRGMPLPPAYHKTS